MGRLIVTAAAVCLSAGLAAAQQSTSEPQPAPPILLDTPEGRGCSGGDHDKPVSA
ncbi:hypothetical protein [Shimia sediminis]|uniref:hypothetical protein n=1 Tax=Shimia sediminis TaxID=2497945 RepID=UPI0013DEE71C|nr:hypothetical protein [Shimia sediminis]